MRSFGEAARLDSNYARAFAGLADSWSMLGVFGYVRGSDAYPRARAAAERAVRLDSMLAEAHVSLGVGATFYDREWDRADREFARAAVLDPSYASTFLFRAWLLMATGHGEEALASVRHARELEPLSLIINARVGTILSTLGHVDEAERDLRATLILDTTFFVTRLSLARVLAVRGRCDEAVRLLPGLTAGYPDEDAGYVYAQCGRRAEARRLLDTLRALRARRYVPSSQFVLAYLGSGDVSAALSELERALRQHDRLLPDATTNPVFAPLWKDPRFAAIRRAMQSMNVLPGAPYVPPR